MLSDSFGHENMSCYFSLSPKEPSRLFSNITAKDVPQPIGKVYVKHLQSDEDLTDPKLLYAKSEEEYFYEDLKELIKNGILQDTNILSDKDLVEALKFLRDKLNSLKDEHVELSEKYSSLMNKYTRISEEVTKLEETNILLTRENQQYKQKRFFINLRLKKSNKAKK